MPIKNNIESILIDVKGSTETTQYRFFQKGKGEINLSSKKTVENYDYELSLNGNKNIRLPLEIKEVRDITSSKINTFILENYLSIVINDEKRPETVTNNFFDIMTLSNNANISVIANITDSTPTVSYPTPKTILLNNSNPSLSMNISDQINQRFFELTLSASLSITDSLQNQSYVNNFTLRPFNTSPGTALSIILGIQDQRQADNINLNYSTPLKYNTSHNILLDMSITDNFTSTVTGGLTHTMKFITSPSISLKMKLQEGDIVDSSASIHTLKLNTSPSITLGIEIFDWIRLPIDKYRYQSWLHYT